jgi:uncharacterized membrane protein required for colicin V production
MIQYSTQTIWGKGMNRQEISRVLMTSFIVAIIIFMLAVLSDFSVRMYYSGTDPTTHILGGLLGIGVMTLFIAFVLFFIPDIRKAISRMFGLEKE